MAETTLPRCVGVIGAGIVTAGWVARFLVNGIDVRLHLPDGGDATELRGVVALAERAWRKLTMVPLPTLGRLSLERTPEAAVVGASLVHVGVGADTALLADISAALPDGVALAVEEPALGGHPARAVAVQAFDPAYLVPLVVLSGGEPVPEHLAEIYRQLGMEPVFAADAATRQAFGPGLLGPLAGVEDRERRDDGLIAILQGLRSAGLGAGVPLRRHEHALLDRAHRTRPTAEGDVSAAPMRLLETQVPADWIDYNGHLNESRYLQFFSDGSDALLAYVGVDAAYRAAGASWYTVETHLRHFRELPAQAPVVVESQVLGFDGKRLHLFQWLRRRDDGALAASAEQMLIHVDTKAGRACPAAGVVRDRLERLAAAHAALALPEDAGRRIMSLRSA